MLMCVCVRLGVVKLKYMYSLHDVMLVVKGIVC